MHSGGIPPTDQWTWEIMSIDEYAALETAMGAKLVKTGNMWWREVRPFFYRPLLPYRALHADKRQYPALSRVGGVQHLVPEGAHANSGIDLLLFESPRTYSLGGLKEGSRYHIRRAMRTFSVRPIVHLEEFISKGHGVYVSFYERTRYSYKKERTDPQRFAAWARELFRFPKVRILGAFQGEELASVSVSYVVEGVLFTATFFSSSSALGEYVSDLMLHTIRENAAACEGVTLIFASTAGMERGLDDFYLRRGAKLVNRPALLKMNPLLLFLIKRFKKDDYAKLGILNLNG
jgi:hypothetical protein